MPINIGGTNMDNPQIGGDLISKVYVGSGIVFCRDVNQMPIPQISTNLNNQLINTNVTLTCNANDPDHTTGFTYIWSRNSDFSSPIETETNAGTSDTLVVTETSAGDTVYYCQVTDEAGASGSAMITLTWGQEVIDTSDTTTGTTGTPCTPPSSGSGSQCSSTTTTSCQWTQTTWTRYAIDNSADNSFIRYQTTAEAQAAGNPSSDSIITETNNSATNTSFIGVTNGVAELVPNNETAPSTCGTTWTTTSTCTLTSMANACGTNPTQCSDGTPVGSSVVTGTFQTDDCVATFTGTDNITGPANSWTTSNLSQADQSGQNGDTWSFNALTASANSGFEFTDGPDVTNSNLSGTFNGSNVSATSTITGTVAAEGCSGMVSSDTPTVMSNFGLAQCAYTITSTSGFWDLNGLGAVATGAQLFVNAFGNLGATVTASDADGNICQGSNTLTAPATCCPAIGTTCPALT